MSAQSINGYLASLTRSMAPCGHARRLCLHETKGRGQATKLKRGPTLSFILHRLLSSLYHRVSIKVLPSR